MTLPVTSPAPLPPPVAVSRPAPPRDLRSDGPRQRVATQVGRRAPGAMVRAGLVWAVVLAVATVIGPIGLAVVLVPVVLVATASGLRLARVPPSTRPLVIVVAALVPAAGVGGPTVWLGAVVVAVVAIGLVVASSGNRHPIRLLALVCGPAAGAGALVATAHQDVAVAAMLVVAVCLFDAGNFVVGTGETGGVPGALAGVASVAVLLVGLNAVVDSTLRGRPFLALTAVLLLLLPAGVALGRRITGPTILPAFRRLDSLMVAGPVWVAVVALELHR